MSTLFIKGARLVIGLTITFLILGSVSTQAAIDGVTGTTFNFTARTGYIDTPDGNSIFMWGYALNGGAMQYPGPTMIVNQDEEITINLTNELSVPVSIVFPSQGGVVATGGIPGFLTREAPPGGTVTYTFTASNPGTYMYYSGTRPDLQVEMGLVGALIVRPTGFLDRAYTHADSQFDREFLFLLTEIDLDIHELVGSGRMNRVDTTEVRPVYWFLNGRAGPDTMAPAGAPWLPNQPYNCMPMMHPGDRVLLRLIGAGRDPHPIHHHGNHSRVIAKDGRLLESTPGAGADLSELSFTTTVAPGETFDAIFSWTGEKLGWDVYGTGPDFAHDCNDGDGDDFDDTTFEYCPDHGKEIPVLLPDNKELTFGPQWSGSPFIGALGPLPPGEGGFNPNGGLFFMWHSHNEKELTNNDIFPGGMFTMAVVEHPPDVVLNP